MTLSYLKAFIMKKITIVSLLFSSLLTTVFMIQSCGKSAHDITTNDTNTNSIPVATKDADILSVRKRTISQEQC